MLSILPIATSSTANSPTHDPLADGSKGVLGRGRELAEGARGAAEDVLTEANLGMNGGKGSGSRSRSLRGATDAHRYSSAASADRSKI